MKLYLVFLAFESDLLPRPVGIFKDERNANLFITKKEKEYPDKKGCHLIFELKTDLEV